jgi:hypothetical protein
MSIKIQLRAISLLAAFFLSVLQTPLSLRAQGSNAFTYQGLLSDNGANANGIYNVVFRLYDAATNGNQIAPGLTNNLTVANGVFWADLEFASGAFNGSARWLQINVGGETLTPRAHLLPVPYATFAALAGTVSPGGIANTQLGANSVGSMNLQNGAVSDEKIATETTIGRTIETNLVTTRGIINSNGTITLGEGFTVATVTTPTNVTFNVNFTSPYSGIPAVTIGVHSVSGRATAGLSTFSTTGFSVVNFFGTGTPSGFSFIATGPK